MELRDDEIKQIMNKNSQQTFINKIISDTSKGNRLNFTAIPKQENSNVYRVISTVDSKYYIWLNSKVNILELKISLGG